MTDKEELTYLQNRLMQIEYGNDFAYTTQMDEIDRIKDRIDVLRSRI